MTFIQHVTLNTSHNRPYNRFECRKETIAACRGLLREALAQQAAISFADGAFSHLRMACTAEGRKLVVTVYGPAGPHVPGQPYRGGNVLPLVTFGVAPKSKDARLWEILGQCYEQVYQMAHQAERPQAPWVGVVVLPAALQYRQSLELLADFERCMAWAWLDWLKD